jgi:hypothetical protein
MTQMTSGWQQPQQVSNQSKSQWEAKSHTGSLTKVCKVSVRPRVALHALAAAESVHCTAASVCEAHVKQLGCLSLDFQTLVPPLDLPRVHVVKQKVQGHGSGRVQGV